MLFFMLDPRFKNLWLVLSFIGQEHVVSIVKEYDQWSLSMLLKCCHILHLMAKFGPIVNMQIDEESSLNIVKCLLELVN
jgi:hypothetical protein